VEKYPVSSGGPVAHGNIEFDPFSDTFFNDPSATCAPLRDEAPVYFNERYGFYPLSRYAEVVTAHGDPVRFASSYGVTLESLLEKKPMHTNMMIVMDPQFAKGEHVESRRVLQRPRARALARPHP
jgi:cytochrome P450